MINVTATTINVTDWDSFVVPPDAVGFLYVIYRKSDMKYYIGQKLFYKLVKKKPLKGETKIRKAIVESDWRSYYGSNEELKKEVKALGKDAYNRKMFRVCYSKSEMNYFELKEQMEFNALLDDNSYNGFIGKRMSRSVVPSILKYKGKTQ